MPTTYIALKIRWIPRPTRTSTYTTQTCQIRAGRSRKGQGLVRRTFVLPVLKSRWYACLLLARTRRQKVVESVRTLFRSTYVLLHIYFMSFCETVLLSKIYLDHAHRRAHSFCLRKTLRRQGTSLCECVPRTHVSGWLKTESSKADVLGYVDYLRPPWLHVLGVCVHGGLPIGSGVRFTGCAPLAVSLGSAERKRQSKAYYALSLIRCT